MLPDVVAFIRKKKIYQPWGKNVSRSTAIVLKNKRRTVLIEDETKQVLIEN